MEDRKRPLEIGRLCIRRQPGEAFSFPDLNITVRVVSVFGTGVKLAIDAPKNILILREELERE